MIQTILGLFLAVLIPYMTYKVFNYYVYPVHYINYLNNTSKCDYRAIDNILQKYKRIETIYILLMSSLFAVISYYYSLYFPILLGFSFSSLVCIITVTYLNWNNFDEGKQLIILTGLLVTMLYYSLQYYS